MAAGAKRGPGASHDLETALGHEFRTPALLTQALCHPSVARRTILSNQRLEFLGDRVLGLVVATMLLEQFPREEEGDLAQRFAALVKRAALARVARSLDLGHYVSLGRGGEQAEQDGAAQGVGGFGRQGGQVGERAGFLFAVHAAKGTGDDEHETPVGAERHARNDRPSRRSRSSERTCSTSSRG